MTEIIAPPKTYSLHTSKSETNLRADLKANGERLISIKSHLENGSRVITGVSIANVGITTDWFGAIRPVDLRNFLGAEQARLISLDAYIDAGETFCAAVWVKDAGIWSNWDVDLVVHDVVEKLLEDNGKLTCLRTYSSGRLYAAIWIRQDVLYWSWYEDFGREELDENLERTGQSSLISIDNNNGALQEGVSERFPAVWWKINRAEPWFWYVGITRDELETHFRELCSYPIDAVPDGPGTLACIMVQYPKVIDPKAGNLVDITGSGAWTGLADDLSEQLTTNSRLANLTSDSVTITRAVALVAAPGGWSDLETLLTTDAGSVFGAPTPLYGNMTVNATTPYASAMPIHHRVVYLASTSASGKSQNLLTSHPIQRTNFVPVGPFPIESPIYLGLQGPIEVLHLADDRKWLIVKGQVVNATGETMSVRRLFLRLKNMAGATLYQAHLPLMFAVDDYPEEVLPRFIHAFEVPTWFVDGTLRVEVNVQFRNRCFADTRTMSVAMSPSQQLRPPVRGKWNWGNGPGANAFNPHYLMWERYAYDVAMIGANNSQTKPNTKGAINDDWYGWKQPIHSMADGTVLNVVDGNIDHDGWTPKPQGDNNLVIVDEGTFYHYYYHLVQGSAKVKIGDKVGVGQILGLVGNSGISTNPHLHVGASAIDTTGVLRPVPMRFRNLSQNGVLKQWIPVNDVVYEFAD